MTPALFQKTWPLVWIILCFAAAFGVFAPHVVPPLTDYPNHLARMFILMKDGTDPLLAERYLVDWHFIPNLGMDLIVPILARFIGIYAAGKVFLITATALVPISFFILSRVIHGRFSGIAALSIVLMFNISVQMGFMSYLLSVGLGVLAFAAWIALQQAHRPKTALVLAIGATMVLSVVHLVGTSLFVVSVGAWIGGGIWMDLPPATRQRLRRAFFYMVLISLPIIASALVVHNAQEGAGEKSAIIPYLMKPLLLLDAFGTIQNGTAYITYLLFIVLGLACLILQMIKWHARMGWVVAALSIVFVLCPRAVFESFYVDSRLAAIVIGYLLVAVRFNDQNKQTSPFIKTVIAGFAAFWALSPIWWNAQYFRSLQQNDYIAALSRMEAGARVMFAQDNPDDQEIWSILHMASLATIERQAFVMSNFTMPQAQPIRATRAYEDIDLSQPYALSLSRLSSIKKVAPSASEGLAFDAAKNPVAKPMLSFRSGEPVIDKTVTNVHAYRQWWKDFQYVIVYYPTDDLEARYPDLPLKRVWASKQIGIFAIEAREDH